MIPLDPALQQKSLTHMIELHVLIEMGDLVLEVIILLGVCLEVWWGMKTSRLWKWSLKRRFRLIQAMFLSYKKLVLPMSVIGKFEWLIQAIHARPICLKSEIHQENEMCNDFNKLNRCLSTQILIWGQKTSCRSIVVGVLIKFTSRMKPINFNKVKHSYQ